MLRSYALCAALMMASVGCSQSPRPTTPSGPKITRDEFDQLRVGMTPEEVEIIMGGVHPPGPGVPTVWRFEKDGRGIMVKFENGKLATKESHGL